MSAPPQSDFERSAAPATVTRTTSAMRGSPESFMPSCPKRARSDCPHDATPEGIPDGTVLELPAQRRRHSGGFQTERARLAHTAAPLGGFQTERAWIARQAAPSSEDFKGGQPP